MIRLDQVIESGNTVILRTIDGKDYHGKCTGSEPYWLQFETEDGIRWLIRRDTIISVQLNIPELQQGSVVLFGDEDDE